MKIIDEIKRIVENELELPFIYENFYKINEELDYTNLPCVGCQRLVNGTLNNEAGQIKDSAPFLLFFINSSTYNYSSLENQAIIDIQKETAIDFIRAVEASDLIKYEGEIRYENFYNKFDFNDLINTGVALSITLKERAGSVYCV